MAKPLVKIIKILFKSLILSGGIFLGYAWYVDKFKVSDADKEYSNLSIGLVNYQNFVIGQEGANANTTSALTAYKQDSSRENRFKLGRAYGEQAGILDALYYQGEMNVGTVSIDMGKDSAALFNRDINGLVNDTDIARLKTVLSTLDYAGRENETRHVIDGNKKLKKLALIKEKWESYRNWAIIVGTAFTIVSSFVSAYKEHTTTTQNL